MRLTPKQLQSLQNLPVSNNHESNVNGRVKRALVNTTRLWPNNRIPYIMTPRVFNETQTKEIMKAINEWQNHTCIKFEPANQTDENYVDFDDGAGCSSNVGMIGGVQIVYLAESCRKKRLIIHELGHVIGYSHEQSRPDRDDYVEIMTANIKEQRLFNFKKLLPEGFFNYTPYDYTSIMHYGKTYFSANNQTTMRTKNPAYQDIIGTVKNVSFYDIKDVNIMYNCAGHCQNKPICPGEAFVGKDCKCWCPGKGDNPFVYCSSDPVTPTTTNSPSVARQQVININIDININI
ncbi:astacin-like metalloprotease toxin 5 [Physella acuta]|uniref:astacin-like metalloprotease toxin 5 n=1 Tax=Physella acuta TaxID=109671 RepID=UPI0027DCA14A|nr:astacin-like metalloprotease toxin 5 [Physella acuta]